jgi:arylformamidase
VPSWIDVTTPLREGLVPWPGDPPFRLDRVSDIARGDACTFSRLSMSAHAGTHIDAPLHFIRNGRSVDTLPLDATIGPARIIQIRSRVVIAPDELRPHRIRAGERLLFRTANSTRRRQAGTFFEDYVAVSLAAARYLVSRRVRMVGIDGPSIAPFRVDMAETHRVLLGAGIWVLEGLDLRRAPAGRCELLCLPLKVVGGDGAPARALIRVRKGSGVI